MFDSAKLMYSTGGAEFYDHPINQSLRFNDDDSAYLSWTPASAGNRKTWTFSAWVKRGNMGSLMTILDAGHTGTADSNQFSIKITSSDTFYADTYNYVTQTTAVFRDPSAWYHIVYAIDTTQSSAADRAKIYINGVQQTLSGTLIPTQNVDTAVNSTNPHYLGKYWGGSSFALDGYLAEVHFIDGTALDASSFGEFKSGVWIPKAYSGSYGTNGFYLPFNHDYSVEGFSATTYTGNSSTQYIGGVGFEPDLVWIKKRSDVAYHQLFDSVRGATYALTSNGTNAEYVDSGNLQSFENDGFVYGSHNGGNGSGTYVAWCWDAGSGSPVSNTNGSITSTVKASTTYGFSVVTYTGEASNTTTVGHGLSSAPEMIIVKRRDGASNWMVYHKDVGNSSYLNLNGTAASTSTYNIWNSTSPTSDVFTVSYVSGSYGEVNYPSWTYVAYAFHSVSGYSKIGSYTGNGSITGPTVTTGFKPAFVMVKRTDSTSEWTMFDNVRDTDGQPSKFLYANLSNAEGAVSTGITLSNTGFTLTNTYSDLNASGGTYIYMAFADKREAAFWLDQSGNNNDFENNNLTESDISLDSPTNNFATLNPLWSTSGASFSEGNLKASLTDDSVTASIANSSGKYYYECYIASTGATGPYIGISDDTLFADDGSFNYSQTYVYIGHTGYKGGNGSASAYGATFTTGDIIGVAYDLDANSMTFYKNGVSQGTAFSSGFDGTYRPFMYGSTTSNFVANFGQDSSFAGNKTAQGNTDANGYGDFYYAPPTGYLALCTANLTVPDAMNPALDNSPQDYFNTVLYTGNGSTQSITGVGFQPDWIFFKERSSTSAPQVFDVIRGATYGLTTSDTGAEWTYSNTMTSFDSDGFSLGDSAGTNESGQTYVAWNWKANGSGVSNTDGSITSTVSANTDAGFSIVDFTTTSGVETTGHGLSSAPEMIITKKRDGVNNWFTYHTSLGATKFLYLNEVNGVGTSTVWNDTAPTSSVFTTNASQFGVGNYIAYCFHSVEGFSKFGSYVSNSSNDGPFIYTGFQPALVIIKNITTGSTNWRMIDSARTDYNWGSAGSTSEGGPWLKANASDAEVNQRPVDLLSNGFKIRYYGGGDINYSTDTMIYMAFASMPTKFSLAR